MEYLSGGNNNDTLSAEYLFQGNLDEIDNTTFTPMLLSTIICPQYLRGVGACGRFRVPSSSMPSPFVVHRHSSKRRHPVSSPLTHVSSHGRESASHHHIVIRP
nr:MAG TPA: hypothetical protein [Caudoviricetes sp.]